MTAPHTPNPHTPYGEALGATLIDRSIREKIVLVGVALQGTTDEQLDASLDELELLVDTAGADVVGRIVQRREAPDHTWYVGKGKAEELHQLALAVDADTVVFDNELSPAQQFNLEKLLGRTAIDRTAVILDIFAQNAHTLEGRAQVELALLRYRLPRLRRGRSANLSQQRGGVGSRFGSGETKLEVDRRRITRRISRLETELAALADTRALQRKSRSRSGLANVAIVGYTNAGKSSLLNRLTDAGVLTEDRLFATLDPTTRRLALPGGEPVLLTDTVGFVRNLPHGLIEAFKGTLEVAARADYLVHVVDASAPDPYGQIDAVRAVLTEIDAGAVPELLVFNKSDLAPDVAAELVAHHPGAVAVSAATGAGVDDLLRALADRLRALSTVVELLIPYERGDVIAAVHREGEVVSTTETDAGFRVRARLADASAGRLSEFPRSVIGRMTAAAPFVPPPYPYERVDRFRPYGDGFDGGLLDFSIGTPCDPPPPSVVHALATSDAERGYPPSVGTAALRGAVQRWIGRRFDVDVDLAHIAACVGTKEFVGTLPQWLRLRRPDRDTVLYPEIAYPTYEMGAILAGCRAVPVRLAPSGGLDLASIDPADAGRALALWVNSPGNPSGALDDLGAAATWGRAHGVPVFSDECYVEFTWEGPGRTILEHGLDGVVAVHSLSKRSNLAGGRVGFYAGDPDLVHYLGEVRKHVGMMVPGPVQAAGVAALDDDAHVAEQRHRYLGRLERMAAVLGAWSGLDIGLPAGGFYLWFRAGDAWEFTERLAKEGGALVSPGDFYGAAGAGYVRVAVVQPDAAVDALAARLGV